MKMTDYFSRDEARTFDRHMFRSGLVTTFWNVITDRKRRKGYKLQHLADALGVNKSTVSRWFSASLPNWEADTISDIAAAMDVDVQIVVIDRETGKLYSAGAVYGDATTTASFEGNLNRITSNSPEIYVPGSVSSISSMVS